jgi:hypothetical protein
MENPFAEALADLGWPNHGRLPFEDQCAYYAALKCDVPPVAVANVSGLSQSVVSLLKAAGTPRGGQLRYPKVASEYAAMGHDSFVHKYLTPLIRERLMVEIANLKLAEREKADGEPLNEHGYSPRADSYCRRVEWKQTSIGKHAVFRIELHPGRGGYFWRDLKPYYDRPEIPADQVNFKTELVGDPARGPERGPEAKGFRTSRACYIHVKNNVFDPKL